MVKWDLAGLGILEDGVTYKLAFDVWPNQITYDIAADLNNGIYGSVEEAIAGNGITDEDQIELIKEALHQNEDGSYEIYTNYEQSVEYYEAESQTDENGNTTWTYSEPKSLDLPKPDPIPLEGSELPMQKKWAVELADSELHDLLYNKDGTPTKYGVTLHLWKEETEEEVLAKSAQPASSSNVPYQSFPLGWDEEAGAYIWEKGAAVAPGMMVNLAEAARLGFNTNDTSKIYSFTREGETEATKYYIVEPGHYYMVSEEGGDLHFQLFTEVYHPMIVDGTLYDVALKSDHTVKEMIPMAAVVATNTLKGGLNINKVVSSTQIAVEEDEDEDGNPVTVLKNVTAVPDCTDEFAFTILLWEEDDEGNISPVYTFDDQFEADYKAISGSIGYREFGMGEDGGFVTLGRNVIVFEDTENAAAKIEANKRGDNDPVYATHEGNKTKIVLHIPANGEIRIVNLPAGTKYTVTENLDASGPYTYAATASTFKYSDDDVSDPVITEANTVSGHVPGNTAAVETYYNWAAAFYVYHSGDNTVEKISFSDTRVKGTFADGEYTYDFDIANETKDTFLYGGYYKNYAGKSTGFDATKITTWAEGWYDDSKNSEGAASDAIPYDGDTAEWTLSEAYTKEDGDGLAMHPEVNKTYYLKEVPDTKFLQPYTHYTYYTSNYNIANMWQLSAIDDLNYQETGFVIVKDNEVAKVCKSLTVKNASGGAKVTLKPNTVFRAQGVTTNDYLTYKEVTGIVANKDTVLQYWVTPDGLIVTGITQRTLDGIAKKTTITKTDTPVDSTISVFVPPESEP